MRAFEVFVNNRKVCVAGVRDDESVSAIVCLAPEGPFFTVSGSINPSGDFAKWIELTAINVGDEIRVKMIEAESVDDPISIKAGRG